MEPLTDDFKSPQETQLCGRSSLQLDAEGNREDEQKTRNCWSSWKKKSQVSIWDVTWKLKWEMDKSINIRQSYYGRIMDNLTNKTPDIDR